MASLDRRVQREREPLRPGLPNRANFPIIRAVTHFFLVLGGIYLGLAAAAIFTRLAWAVSDRITVAPALDVFISLFTWVPWVSGALWAGWPGVAASIVAQVLFLHTFCLIHRAIRGKKGRTLTDAQARLLGPVRNQLALLCTAPAAVVFAGARAAELFLYPLIVRLAGLPPYKQGEWVNLSRHKYNGLIGYDLLWCWYCDWMTGVWALGSEMLRNVESFWCPIRFRSDVKNRHASLDFPDVEKWAPADGTMEDVVRLFEKYYDGKGPNSWFGHPDRKKPE